MRSLISVSTVTLCFLLCSASAGSNTVPVGFSTYFTSTECPPGWRQLEETRGRLVVSTANPNNAGVTVNTPFTVTSSGEPQDITHSHDYSALVTVPALGIAAIAGCCDHAGAEHGSYPVAGTSDDSNSGYPFTQLLMCTYFGSSSNGSSPAPTPTVAYGTVGFFNPGGESSTCPSKWVPMHSSEGRVLLPGYKNQGGEVRNDRPALASGEDRMHNHTYSIPIHLNEMSFVGAGRCCDDNNGKFETVSFANGTTVSASSNLPYIQLLTCVSQVESFNQTLPGARTFTSISCPPQYQVATDNSGRMLVSLPEGGNPGATFGGDSIPPPEEIALKRLTPGEFVRHQTNNLKNSKVVADSAAIYQSSGGESGNTVTHSHPISGSVTIPSSSTTLVDGCCDHGYAQQGQYAYLAQSDLSGVGLPYSMLPMCEFVGEGEKRRQ